MKNLIYFLKASFYKKRLLIFCSIIFWLVFSSIAPGEFCDIGGDSAQYIILAESIAKGGGYCAINSPQKNIFYHYPPFFALLLSGIIYVWGRNFFLMHIMVALFGYGAMLLLYGILKKYISPKKAFLITLFFATSWPFVLYSGVYILSDIPYLFFSLLALSRVLKYVTTEKTINREGLFSLFAILAAFFTRYIGVALFSGLIIFLLAIKKFKKAVFVGFGFFVFLSLWILIIKGPLSMSASYVSGFFLIDSYRPYLGSLLSNPGYVVTRIIEAVRYYYNLTAEIFIPVAIIKISYIKNIFAAGFFILVLKGFLSEAKSMASVFSYYYIVYFLFIIIWPFKEGPRLLLPILGFLLFYAGRGLQLFWPFFKSRGYRIVPVLVACFLILNIINTFNMSSYSVAFNKPKGDFIAMHYWIKENLSTPGIIVSRKPSVTYLYTGHKSIIYPYVLNSDDIWREILKYNAKYLLVDDFSGETFMYLAPFIYDYKEHLKILHRINQTAVFEIVTDNIF